MNHSQLKNDRIVLFLLTMVESISAILKFDGLLTLITNYILGIFCTSSFEISFDVSFHIPFHF